MSSNPVGTRTRARTKDNKESTNGGANVDVTYYTTLEGDERGQKIQVVSKRKVKKGNEKEQEKVIREKLKRIKEREGTNGTPRPPLSNNNSGRILFVTHLNIFLYAACYFIQVNTMPYLTKKLGADSATFGQLQTVFAVVMLVGGPVYGRMGDLMGERMALMMAFSAAASTYGLMGVAHSVPVLFLSRLPSVLLHVMQGSQMLVTHLTNESERATALSRLGFSYGIGMVVGPTLGGHISKHFGEHFAALVAAAGSVLSLLLVALFIPHFPKSQDRKKNDDSNPADEEGGSVMDFGKIVNLILVPGAGTILLIKLVCGTPIGILQSMFSVIAMENFDLKPDQNGMMLSFIGMISIFMQGVGISFFTRFFSDSSLMAGSTIVLTVTYFVLTLVSDVYQFVGVLFPLTCALCLVNSILTAAVTKTVPKGQTGTMLGLNMAVHSVIRTVAPTVGGFLLNSYGFESLGYMGVACNLAVLGMLNMAEFKEEI